MSNLINKTKVFKPTYRDAGISHIQNFITINSEQAPVTQRILAFNNRILAFNDRRMELQIRII